MLKDMVVWISSAACNMPVNQRAKVLAIADGHLLIKLLGIDKITSCSIHHICGIELSETDTIKFNVIEIIAKG
jgi:hypothetical protein